MAKQAAEVDILSHGRLRLGIGLGWNPVEYEALGKRFSDRGRRVEEQVGLLRRLWVESSVSYDGRYEQVTGAGLAPLPRQRPIPIWFGAQSPPALRRAGRLADGWFPQAAPGPQLEQARALVEEGALEVGRDPASLGLEGRVSWDGDGAEAILDTAGAWREAGATHLSINTMGAGLRSVEDHLSVLAATASALGLGPV